ncbi:endonuclease MutS2 [Thermocrinis minervae]|uniref:Endonuclease MutS2 n=1 Tax=Thermocrinis minervae TaxID=381751 RepID=A0A1M6SM66_9AQUI|nr:endonuclease MutS2 [Thermocrinis minervae]SHK45812.1 DNA mismatch repair protein MutS2 [Thermocrinis minervae]
MREQDLIRLEYFKVLDYIKNCSHCPATKDYIQTLRPYSSPEQIKEAVRLTEDFLRVADRLELYPFEDVEPLIKKSAIKDYALSVEELLSLLKVLKLVKEVRKAIGPYVESYPALQQIVKNLHSFPQLESAIESSIDPRGFVKDSASLELSEIRHKIRSIEKEVQKRLESFLSRPDAHVLFSDRIIAFKNNRYVLPVKTSEVKKIVGLVHGVSSSGFTTYVEPQSVVELNNQLVILRNQEDEEIKKVLRRITSIVGEHSSQLIQAFKALVLVDYLLCVYRYAREVSATFPKVSDKIELLGVRHPVLVILGRDVVPVDIKLPKGRGLLLTGPNTGGKTVALKSLGLCVLLFQTGIPIPVKEGSTIAIFEKVFTDIGDEQSIEQNLSTFSSHMKNLAEFLPLVDENTLVLLDELGAGTDPVEGSALAIGLLEYLKERKATVMANTHHTPVKVYALNSGYYIPASVAFDKETLKPLYRIDYNTLGSSMAFDIAKSCGIPEEVLRLAKSYTPEGFEEYIKAKESLEKYVQEYQEKLRNLELLEEELSRKKAEEELLLSKIKKMEEEAIKEAYKKAEEYLNRLMEEGQKLLSSARERKKLKEFVQSKKEEIREVLKEEPIGVGDWVEFMGSKGRVVQIKDDKARVVFGSVSAWVKTSELKKAERPVQLRGSTEFEGKKSLPSEINLIGLTVEEALQKLELFLEEAKKLGVKKVKVIHGTGPLKRAVQEFLENSDFVVFYRDAYPREGGSGASVVYLEKP